MSTQSRQNRSGIDLTEGPIITKILLFALPLIASNLLQQFYNVADSVIIGRFAGSEPLAAVGSSNTIMMLFNALFMGVSMGANIVVSQTFGARDFAKLRRAINSIIGLAFVVGTAITIVGVTTCWPLLRVMNVPDNIINHAHTYLTIIFAGTLGNVFFNYGGGILRGMGDSKWPLAALCVSCVLNIGLNIWFVYSLGMGTAGVAWATVIGQTISGMVMAWRINHFGYDLKISPRNMLHPDWGIVKQVLRLGLPSGFQGVAMSLGGVVIQSFTNRFGSTFIAANTIVMRVDGFVLMPIQGLSMSATTFVGQNTGAGKLDRAKAGISRILVMVIALAIVLGFGMYHYGYFAVYAFTTETEVTQIAMQGIRIICFIYVCMGLDGTFAGAMRGSGVVFVPMITAIATNVVRIPIVFLLAILPNNYLGVFYSQAAAMSTGAIVNGLYYFFGNWRKKGASVASAGATVPPVDG